MLRGGGVVLVVVPPCCSALPRIALLRVWSAASTASAVVTCARVRDAGTVVEAKAPTFLTVQDTAKKVHDVAPLPIKVPEQFGFGR